MKSRNLWVILTIALSLSSSSVFGARLKFGCLQVKYLRGAPFKDRDFVKALYAPSGPLAKIAQLRNAEIGQGISFRTHGKLFILTADNSVSLHHLNVVDSDFKAHQLSIPSRLASEYGVRTFTLKGGKGRDDSVFIVTDKNIYLLKVTGSQKSGLKFALKPAIVKVPEPFKEITPYDILQIFADFEIRIRNNGQEVIPLFPETLPQLQLRPNVDGFILEKSEFGLEKFEGTKYLKFLDESLPTDEFEWKKGDQYINAYLYDSGEYLRVDWHTDSSRKNPSRTKFLANNYANLIFPFVLPKGDKSLYVLMAEQQSRPGHEHIRLANLSPSDRVRNATASGGLVTKPPETIPMTKTEMLVVLRTKSKSYGLALDHFGNPAYGVDGDLLVISLPELKVIRRVSISPEAERRKEYPSFNDIATRFQILLPLIEKWASEQP